MTRFRFYLLLILMVVLICGGIFPVVSSAAEEEYDSIYEGHNEYGQVWLRDEICPFSPTLSSENTTVLLAHVFVLPEDTPATRKLFKIHGIRMDEVDCLVFTTYHYFTARNKSVVRMHGEVIFGMNGKIVYKTTSVGVSAATILETDVDGMRLADVIRSKANFGNY